MQMYKLHVGNFLQPVKSKIKLHVCLQWLLTNVTAYCKSGHLNASLTTHQLNLSRRQKTKMHPFIM